MKGRTIKYIFFGMILLLFIGLFYTNAAGKKQNEELKNDYILYQQAMQLLENEQLEEGAKMLEAIIQKYPDEYTLYYNLGLAYHRQQQYEKAAITLQQALNLRPALLQDRTFTFTMGESLYHIQQYEKAKIYLSKPVNESQQKQKEKLLQFIEKEIQA